MSVTITRRYKERITRIILLTEELIASGKHNDSLFLLVAVNTTFRTVLRDLKNGDVVAFTPTMFDAVETMVKQLEAMSGKRRFWSRVADSMREHKKWLGGLAARLTVSTPITMSTLEEEIVVMFGKLDKYFANYRERHNLINGPDDLLPPTSKLEITLSSTDDTSTTVSADDKFVVVSSKSYEIALYKPTKGIKISLGTLVYDNNDPRVLIAARDCLEKVLSYINAKELGGSE